MNAVSIARKLESEEPVGRNRCSRHCGPGRRRWGLPWTLSPDIPAVQAFARARDTGQRYRFG